MTLLRDAEAALLATVASLRPASSSTATAAAAGAGAGAESGGKKGKKKAGKKEEAVVVPPHLAAVGITIGVEALPVTTAALPTDAAVFHDCPEGASSGTEAGVRFEALSDGADPAKAIAVVDALVARLRFKRSYYYTLLQLVRCDLCVEASSHDVLCCRRDVRGGLRCGHEGH